MSSGKGVLGPACAAVAILGLALFAFRSRLGFGSEPTGNESTSGCRPWSTSSKAYSSGPRASATLPTFFSSRSSRACE